MQTTERAVHATEILRAEHEVILDVLDCLEKVAAEAARGSTLDVRSAADILDFLGQFADRCHHGKEEDALFPRLEKKGLPRQVGPLAVMLSEHDQGRAEIAGMREALADIGRGARAEKRFVKHARAYVELLREHIAKENNVLFPMADGMLDAQEQADLLQDFASIEHVDMGAGVHEHYLALARSLAERLGLERKARPAVAGGGCCGHGHHRCG